MIPILYGFGCGIAFFFGLVAGMVLFSSATRKGRDEMKEEVKEHYTAVEARLLRQVDVQTKICEQLKRLADLKEGGVK